MERRQRKRIPLLLDTCLKVNDRTLTFSETRDVSMSGLFLYTETPFPPGTRGELTISLEWGEEKIQIRAQCEVVRTILPGQGTPGMGLVFTEIDPDSSINLFNLIRYQEQDG